MPSNPEEVLELDRKHGYTIWFDSMKRDQLDEYATFQDLGKGAAIPKGYTKIKVNMIFDVKQDGRFKSRCCVANGNMAPQPSDSTYSGVVSLRSMRMVMFIAELNGLDLCAGDVGNAYL